MILREFILVATLMLEFGLSANVQSREHQGMTLSECAARGGECDETKTVPICGTDDQTYPSRCHLLRAQCSGHEVSLKYHGPCNACKVARKYARTHKSSYLPRCKADGTYASIQCAKNLGCWCTDLSGKFIINTTVRKGRPACKGLNTRRSPVPNPKPKKNRRPCNKTDRLEFNAKLIKHFEKEFNRSGFNSLPTEKTVLSWKFASLDLNQNQMLDKNEFRELKKLVKRAMKPARCGRTFGKFCDEDGDSKLSRMEWNSCLSNEEKRNLQTKSDPPKEEAESDCFMERETALENQSQGGTATLFLPECTTDGRYQKVQCYKSTPYCWCVYEDTGKPIPGTSVKNKRPQCESFPVLSRVMKGCPETKKFKFLKDLKDFLKSKFPFRSEAINGSSEDEVIAKRSFIVFDKDLSEKWERKEWKIFRKLVSSSRNLKKCGKKFPRYCDSNSDRIITLSEWMKCLQTQKIELDSTQISTNSSESVTRSSKLIGSNPLDEYLKE